MKVIDFLIIHVYNLCNIRAFWEFIPRCLTSLKGALWRWCILECTPLLSCLWRLYLVMWPTSSQVSTIIAHFDILLFMESTNLDLYLFLFLFFFFGSHLYPFVVISSIISNFIRGLDGMRTSWTFKSTPIILDLICNRHSKCLIFKLLSSKSWSICSWLFTLLQKAQSWRSLTLSLKSGSWNLSNIFLCDCFFGLFSWLSEGSFY